MHLISLFIPLFASIYIGLFGRFLGGSGGFKLAVSSILISWFSCFFWFGKFKYISFGIWFTVSTFNIYWTFNFSSLSWIMYFVVTTVALIVYLFSFYYLSSDPHLPRFFMYLLLFTFFMLLFIVGDNLLLVFWGWEGVGLCSFLLINFWYSRISANKAALKAVFVNKISDLFLFFGIIAIINETNTAELPVFFSLIPFLNYKIIYIFGIPFNFLNVVALLFLGGVVGKSAQIGLHIWLPDAMEGPTPVSALIHAATMVTAGVFLLIRFSILFEHCPKILKIILFLGCLTAFMSAVIGSFQYDVKKIIAYSTCSQLGYMVVSCGLSNYILSLYHLVNHAFFKALLFLSSGLLIVIFGEQDIRKYNIFYYKSPLLLLFFLIPNLSLCGFPFFSGAFSKELIIQYSILNFLIEGNFVFHVLLFSAGLTTFYSFTLLYRVFNKNPNIYIKTSLSKENKFYHNTKLSNNPNLHLTKIHISPTKPNDFAGSAIYYFLGILLFLSITSGYLLSDIFLGLGSDFFSKSIFVNPLQNQIGFEKHFEIFFVKYIPLCISFFFFFFFFFFLIILIFI